MSLTDYHASYFAHELTRRCASDSLEKLAETVAGAQVDLNPHQVDAALFAFNSPLSKGALLADEVGLGKTIEAGLVISQKWAERKRRILVIVPSNLRKQWYLELTEKFFLPCRILESKSYNAAVKQGATRPFECDDVIICSYQFARKQAQAVAHTAWDLVVLDEAHRLRNIYKPPDKSKTARALKDAVILLLGVGPAQAGDAVREITFVHEVIDAQPPRNPWFKIIGDLDGNGRPDVIIGGQNGDLVWYANPGWRKTVIADGGWNGVRGATGDIDGDTTSQRLLAHGSEWTPAARRASAETATTRPGWALALLARMDESLLALGDLPATVVLSLTQSRFSLPLGPCPATRSPFSRTTRPLPPILPGNASPLHLNARHDLAPTDRHHRIMARCALAHLRHGCGGSRRCHSALRRQPIVLAVPRQAGAAAGRFG
jgi:hypothetical protein